MSTSSKSSKLPGSKPDLSKRLRSRLTKAFYSDDKGEDRVFNRAVRYDPLEVHDFPSDLQYQWVPAPGGTAPDMHSAADMAQKRAEMVQRGWNYYPSEEFGRPGDTPWMHEWRDDDGRVRSMDHWLVYTDRDMQKRKTQENLDRWNRKHSKYREGMRNEGKGGAVFSQYDRKPLTEKELLDDLQGRMEEAGYDPEADIE